ncbi:MAG: sulfite exporter TauE/SafE family protein [Candidatus Thiodiazotropha sp.]
MTRRNQGLLLFAVSGYFVIAGIILLQLNGREWVLDTLSGFGHFFLLGLGGAIVANSTGAGGGIVFIPAFSALGLSPSQALSTSIMIQCFGMTAGTISWYISFRSRAYIYQRYRKFLLKGVLTAALFSIIGAVSSQLLFRSAITISMLSLFSGLSILFGLTLLFSNRYTGRYNYPKTDIALSDYLLVAPVCFAGGVITSVISIGVGEILLILLFLRRYPLHISIFAAVFVSAITVIACAPYQILVEQSVVWEIVAFAAPAAVIGGVLGRYFAHFLGANRIKIFCAIWILVTGVAI